MTDKVSGKLLPLLVFCALSQGCVGVFYRHTTAEVFDKPRLGQKADTHMVTPGNGAGETVDVAWLKKQWGQPTSISSVSEDPADSLLTYEIRKVWCGLELDVLIPVPLLLPVRTEKVEFLVRDDQVRSARVVRRESSGAGFGLLGPDGPWSYAH